MPELVLPGVYIEVRPEALIVPGPITIGNIGIVGTAAAGPVGTMQVLGSFADAKVIFGSYDAFEAPIITNHELTLVRALEQAYANGASTVLAVRVASNSAAAAKLDLPSATGTAATISAMTVGTAGNNIKVKVESISATQAKVTVTYQQVEEVYTVATGTELVNQVTAGSAIVKADPGSQPAEVPKALTQTSLAGGNNGADASAAEYQPGLDALLNEDAQIMVAAGLDDATIGSQLDAHCQNASTDKIKRDRIGVVGSTIGATASTKPTHFSDRLIFVAPGIKVVDAAKAAARAADPTVILPGAYAAAAVAGMLAARDPQVSLTNKAIQVSGLEKKFNSAQLEQLVLASVLALEDRNGFRVVKGITTDSGAFRQITTRRIVDYAKFGVRSAAEPFIGLLNNDRVRKALKGAINGFLAGMVDDEMLESYELDVSATRQQEISGIVVVTMTLRPTFSIDFIKVVMFLG
jgi:hypothetical protein